MSIITRDNHSGTSAINAFMGAAKTNPQIMAMLAQAQQNHPDDIRAVFKAVGLETLGNVYPPLQSNGQPYPLVRGQPVTDPGIPFGHIKAGRNIFELELIPDFLRDSSGQILLLSADQAVEAVADFNEGVKYGNGYEKDTIRAMAKSQFQDGKLIFAREIDAHKIARVRETNPGLALVNKIIAEGTNAASTVVTSTECPGNPAFITHYKIKNDDKTSDYKEYYRSRVLVLRARYLRLAI